MTKLSNDSKIALGILFLIILFFAGWAETRNRPAAPAGGMSGPGAPDQTPYGAILSISGDLVTITMRAPFQQQSVQYALELTASTTIVRHINKSPEEFAKELAAFNAGEASTSPQGYTMRPASRSDLKVGMVIEAPGAVESGSTWTASAIIIDADSAPATSTLAQ